MGLATTGNGIKVVDAINGATTIGDAFALGHKLQAGAYNYTLNRGTTDESWYLSGESIYRSEDRPATECQQQSGTGAKAAVCLAGAQPEQRS